MITLCEHLETLPNVFGDPVGSQEWKWWEMKLSCGLGSGLNKSYEKWMRLSPKSNEHFRATIKDSFGFAFTNKVTIPLAYLLL